MGNESVTDINPVQELKTFGALRTMPRDVERMWKSQPLRVDWKTAICRAVTPRSAYLATSPTRPSHHLCHTLAAFY